MGYLNLLKIGMHVLIAKIRKQRVPFQVYIRILDQCNQYCTYCKDDYPRQNKQTPTKKQLFDLIDGLAHLGTKRITLFGGEPLLRDDVYEIVQRVKSHNINCSLTTNGWLIDKHREILTALDLLSVSVDGDRIANDAYRGKGSYDAAINAVKIARDAGLPVQLTNTITNVTDFKLTHLTTLAQGHKCSIAYDILTPLFKEGGGILLRPEDKGKEGIDTFLDYQLEHKNPRAIISPEVLRYIRNWPVSYNNVFRLFEEQLPGGFNPIRCYGGTFYAMIEASGDLFPCCIKRPDYIPVNVFKLGAEKAWRLMPQNKCVTCRTIGHNMLNAIFSLNINTLLSIIWRERMNKLG